MLDELDQEVEMNFTRYRVLTQYYNTSFRIAKFEVEMNFTRYRVLTHMSQITVFNSIEM